MRFKLFLLITIVFLGCKQPINEDNEDLDLFQDSLLLKIANLQNERKSHELISILTSEKKAHRIAVALSFASIQDTAFVLPLNYSLLHDSLYEVRKAAAYSLGQTGGKQALEKLIEAFELEQDPRVKNEILESIGKCDFQQASLFLSEVDSLTYGLLWGIYRTVFNKTFISPLIERAIQGLTSNDRELELAAAHILGRLRDQDLTEYRSTIYSFLHDSQNQAARIALTNALRQIHSEDKKNTFLSLLNNSDYRVVINALRGVDDLVLSEFSTLILNTCLHPNDQVARTSVEVISSNPKYFGSDKIKLMYKSARSEDLKTDLAGLILSDTLDERINNELKSIIKESHSSYSKFRCYNALARHESNHSYIIEQFNSCNEPVLMGFIFELLPNSYLSYEFLKGCINDENIALRCLAAHKLRKKEFRTLILNDVDYYKTVLSELTLPLESEAWLEINKLLCSFDKGYCPKQLPFIEKTKINWQLAFEIKPDQQILVKTSKGSIFIQLNFNDAPGAVSKIFELVKQGFYDGKTFHRVVPNFVVQGGCPRGDGWGSLDFALPSEFAPLKYRTGTVGLASAGKDTESCQFFITHSPAPHLEGRYTVIGHVIEGMDVVHQLTVGDKINSVSVL